MRGDRHEAGAIGIMAGPPVAASTIARMPRRTGFGQVGPCVDHSGKAGSETAFGAIGALDFAPPVSEFAAFSGILAVGLNPSTGIAAWGCIDLHAVA